MGDAHGRVGRVDRLAAGTRGPVDVDLEVSRVDLHLHVFRFRQHCHGRGGGVNTPLGLRLGYALDAMSAALEFEHRIGTLALDGECVAALADRQRLDLEAAPLRVAGEHPVQIAGP